MSGEIAKMSSCRSLIDSLLWPARTVESGVRLAVSLVAGDPDTRECRTRQPGGWMLRLVLGHRGTLRVSSLAVPGGDAGSERLLPDSRDGRQAPRGLGRKAAPVRGLTMRVRLPAPV